MSYGYSEETLVEVPAIELLQKRLGWGYQSARDDNLLGRETKGDAYLPDRLRHSLETLNPGAPASAIDSAFDEIVRDRTAQGIANANREVMTLLKEGVKVELAGKNGATTPERLRVIDWENPSNNDFLVVNQFSVTGSLYTRRPDIVCFVNGLPWIVIELKKPGVSARAGFDDNLRAYKEDVPQLFWSNVVIMASNGSETKLGSITAAWEHLAEWKRVEREDEPPSVSLEKALLGTCDKKRLLDIAENFSLFSEESTGLAKIVSKNHQFLGVNNAIDALKSAHGRHGKIGVFWHTQGSGKSYSMLFFAQKVLRKVQGNWTFVVITDRTELDEQIYGTFVNCGATKEKCQAESSSQLRQLLTEDHRYVFTLIHKFRTEPGVTHPVLSTRDDIIVITDEAHRSQYDTLALNMRSALPNALFLAFTGTPLIAGEEKTKEVFGDYVSIYDFKQSIEDGATVPLFYENRTSELHIDNPTLNEEIYQIIEEAELDAATEAKLQRQIAQQYHIITREDRLDKVAEDVVRHFLARGYQGKAMVVSIDKATAVRMFTKVNAHWEKERKETEKQLKADPENFELQERLLNIDRTDMAVVVSSGQNEIEEMKKFDIDFKPHRERMVKEDLADKFKKPEDPLRLVFVCAMWLTGFDAPSCSTVYLDKPMRNHTLMQTIARANRVYGEKKNGLIVDYANVFASLREALAIYGQGSDGKMPVQDKSELLQELHRAILDAAAFCQKEGVDLNSVVKKTGFDKIAAMEDAVNVLISPDPKRKEFFRHEKYVVALYRSVKPDRALVSVSPTVSAVALVAERIRARLRPETKDATEVIRRIQDVLDHSIDAEAFALVKPADEDSLLDLSRINFDALLENFKKSKRKSIDLERLRHSIEQHLNMSVTLNSTRIDYLQKFTELIDSYNAGSLTIEDTYKKLIAQGQALTEEQKRSVREQLSEEELVIFDLLTRPGPDLTKKEEAQVKKAAKTFIKKLTTVLTLDWRKRASARAQVKLAIEDVFDAELPRAYPKDVFEQKCALVFEHVYEKYEGEGKSVYQETG